jgi:nucleoid DNA-binding protein
MFFPELVDMVTEAFYPRLIKEDIRRVIRVTFQIILLQMAAGRKVKIPSFGEFSHVYHAKKHTHEIGSKKDIYIPRQPRPRFRFYDQVKDWVSEKLSQNLKE